MDHVLLWAPNPAGHRLYYIGLLARHATLLGLSVTIATQHSAEFEENAELHLASLGPAVQYLFVSDTSLAGIQEAARRTRATLVLAPDGDQVAWDILRSGRWKSDVPIRLLVMRPSGQSGVRTRKFTSSIVKLAARNTLSLFPRVSVFTLASSLTPTSPKGTAPDPVSSSSTEKSSREFRLKHGLTKERYWFAVVGALDERKNVAMVADAISRLGQPAGLMFIGKMSPEVRAQSDQFFERLRECKVGVITIDRLLTNDEVDDAIHAADCVVLAHSNEGSSGVLGKAAASGTRVIASGARSLRKDSAYAPALCAWVPLKVDRIAAEAAAAMTKTRPAALQLDSDQFAASLLGPKKR